MMKNFDPRVKAREAMQAQLVQKEGVTLRKPQWTDDKPPPHPNVYSDGSVHNPRSTHWQIGGVGIWWPERKLTEEPLNENEENICTLSRKISGYVVGTRSIF